MLYLNHKDNEAKRQEETTMKYDNMKTIHEAFNDIYESEIEDYDNKEDFNEDLAKL